MRFFIIAIFSLIVGCGPSPGSEENDSAQNNSEMDITSDSSLSGILSDDEKAEGWELLFDGQTKNGWHSYLGKGNSDAWKTENGVLYLKVDSAGENAGDLVTDQDFENFHLKIDWKISKDGNSGIMFGVKESPEFQNDYHTGPEMQVLDNDGHPDAKINKHRAGDLYDLITSSSETVTKAGEWNTAEIIKNKDTLEFRLNGPTVVKTTLWDDNWKKMVANSKFKEWKSFGTFKSGKIALQDHGNEVWFRNIKIRKL